MNKKTEWVLFVISLAIFIAIRVAGITNSSQNTTLNEKFKEEHKVSEKTRHP